AGRLPPVLGVLLRPAGGGLDELVRVGGAGDHLARFVHQQAFGGARADVETDHPGHLRPSITVMRPSGRPSPIASLHQPTNPAAPPSPPRPLGPHPLFSLRRAGRRAAASSPRRWKPMESARDAPWRLPLPVVAAGVAVHWGAGRHRVGFGSPAACAISGPSDGAGFSR